MGFDDLLNNINYMNKKKILLTIITIPFLTEMLSGNSSIIELANPLFLIMQIIFYGFPLLLIREAMIKWDLGLIGLLILGFAYGMFNEGVIATTFAQTQTLLGETAMSQFIIGLNPFWVVFVSLWHAFFAVIFPLGLIQYIYPEKISWLSRRTITWFIAVLVVGSLVSLVVNKQPQIIISLICIPILVLVARVFKKKYLVQYAQPATYKSFWIGFMFIGYIIFSIMLAKVLSFTSFFVFEILGLILFYGMFKIKKLLSPLSLVLCALGAYTSMALFIGIILPAPHIVLPNLIVIICMTIYARRIIKKDNRVHADLQMSI